MSNSDKPFQTRSEENGLMYYSSLEEAMNAAKEDPTIWKISFALASGERMRLIRMSPYDMRDPNVFGNEPTWIYQSIEV